MKITKSLNITILTLFGLTLPLTVKSQVYTISIDTTSANDWTVSGGGANDVTPFFLSAPFPNASGGYDYLNALSMTSTFNSIGSFVQGGSLADFDGYWVADFTFFLPANAASISLNCANFGADDRVVLALNGAIFDATGLFVPWVQNGTPSMVLTDGGPLEPYSSFSGSLDGFVSGNVTSGFNIGGLNTIEAIINNTGNGVYGPNQNVNPNDGTAFSLSGTVSYSVVPEPSSPVLVVLGSALLALRHMRSRRG